MHEEIKKSLRSRMDKTIESLKDEFKRIRSGRASAGLVEGLIVEYYGSRTPLKQLASISVPEPRLIVIQPWDRSSTSSIEKSILKSDLGLNPASDGNVIRLSIPPLTEERRHEMIKLLHRRVEERKVGIRNLRREAMEELRKLEKEKEISQDEYKRALDQLQKLTDSFTAAAEKSGQDKEAELIEV